MTVALENVRGARPAPGSLSVSRPPALSPLAIASDRCKGCELCIGA